MKKLIWYGPPYSYSGYGVHNRSMIFELIKLGWNIKLIPTENHIPSELIGKDLLLRLNKINNISPTDTITINLVPPTAVPSYSAYTILYTTLESKTVHPGYLNRCKLYDEVWVPCLVNYKSMLKSGYPRNRLYYCPEGVYSGFWNPDAVPHPKYKSPLFTFFFNGDWSYRKGIDILIRAYAKAFLPSDPVRLLLLVHYQGNCKEVSERVIISELQSLCLKYNIKQLPKIDFIFDHIPDDQLPNIYTCSDIYVSPTRGEAWGLPIIQALSCSVPAIVPKWGGHMDFCNNNNSFLSSIDDFDIIHDKVNLTVDFYWDQLFCFPNLNHFTKLMRYAFSHPDECKKKGISARKYILDNFQWSNSAKIAERRLLKIYESRYFAAHSKSLQMDKRMYTDFREIYTT